MESIHPSLKSRGLSKRLGLMRAAHMGLLNNYLDLPLENHNPNFLLAAETSFLAEHHSYTVWRDPTAAKLWPEDHCVGEQLYNMNTVLVAPLTFRVVGGLREPGALLALWILPLSTLLIPSPLGG